MIDRELARFLQDGRSILVGTRNERLEPSCVRGVAARVEDDGGYVVIYVPQIGATDVLADLESNGQAAAVFCRVTDDRTYQVKGTFVEAKRASSKERAFVLGQWERTLSELAAIGYATGGTAQWVAWPAMALRIRVTALFDQTPGPNAGAALR